MCAHEEKTSRPVRVVESYCQPVYKSFSQPCANGSLCTAYKMQYETQYRTVVKYHTVTERKHDCCPGWSRSPLNPQGCTQGRSPARTRSTHKKRSRPSSGSRAATEAEASAHLGVAQRIHFGVVSGLDATRFCLACFLCLFGCFFSFQYVKRFEKVGFWLCLSGDRLNSESRKIFNSVITNLYRIYPRAAVRFHGT